MNTVKISAFEIVDHGIEHSQHLQGCGVSFTKFTDVATGIGDSAAEALEDALDQLAMGADYDPSDLDDIATSAKGRALTASTIDAHDYCEPDEHTEDCDDPEWHADCELHYFVSVRVKRVTSVKGA